jgi:hypothetical protein
MLTGALPFKGSTPEEVIYARFDTAGPRPLAAVVPTKVWPAVVQGVIDRALARDAAGRFDTAGEFAGALSGAVMALQGAPATPAPPNVAERGKDRPKGPRRPTWFERHARQIARIGAVGVIGAVVIAAGVRALHPKSSIGTQADADTLQRISGGEATLRNDPNARTVVVPAGNDVKPNDSIEPHVKRDTPVRPRETLGDDAAVKELDQLRVHLHPDSAVSEASARAALKRLDALMPRLRTRDDSLFAMLYQSHAYYHLGDLDGQCAVLRRLRSQARGSRIAPVVEGYFGYGKCADS